MHELFESGRVVDGILILMVVEFFCLLRFRPGFKGRSLLGLAMNFAAGAALLLALRAALTNSWWPVVSFYLGVALVAHLLDLFARYGPAVPPAHSTPKY